MPETMLVRIKPGSERKQHVLAGKTFVQERGWYDVPMELAQLCAAERISDADPTSAEVFDVTTREDAEKGLITERLAKVGTVERPNVIAAPPAEPEAAPAPARVGRRSEK